MARRLNLAVVCYPSLGGSGIIAADLAAGMAERGHCVHLVATSLPSRRLPEHPGLTFHEVRVADYPLFEHPPYAIAVAATLVEIATTRGLDWIHAHYAIPHAASAYLARQVLAPHAPRIITTLHGTDVTQLGHDPSYRSITRYALEQSDRVTAPSQFLRAEAYRLLGLDPGRQIEVIPNFVDTDQFAPAQRRDRHRLDGLFDGSEDAGAPVLFHVSNFRPIKRVTDTIEVLARLRERHAARLVLVGDGPDRLLVAQRARALGVDRSVVFLGKRTDFAGDLRHADGFLLPSASESFGVAALEALSSGVPVFGYRVGGLPEVVTPDTGILVPPNDVAALADAVATVLGDTERGRRMGHSARSRAVAHFRREPAFDAYARLLEAEPDATAAPVPHREAG